MNRRASASLPILFVALAALIATSPASAQQARNFAKWEPAIAAFEKQDKEKPPAKNGIVFVGSSTIRFWDLKKSFPGVDALNRGFGGSELGDSVHFLSRLVLKHEPRIVVVYAGDNDLGAGKTPEKVAADFEALATQVHKELPKAKLVFISIKPSILRWKLFDKIQKANGMVQALCKQDERNVFVDITPICLGKDGKPMPDLFRADGLHFSEKGYEEVSKAIAPLLR